MHINRQLLDRQIIDRRGRLIGKVDDLTFGIDRDVLYVRGILVGQAALGRRFGGMMGRFSARIIAGTAGQMMADCREIPFSLVAHIDSAVLLRQALHEPPTTRLSPPAGSRRPEASAGPYVRAGELLGREAYDPQGRRLGRIVDVVVDSTREGPLRVVAVIVARRWYGRLLGPLQEPTSGPWLVGVIARLLSRKSQRVSPDRIRLDPPVAGFASSGGH